MANDSRKDNRVKIVSLSVRYKSATVDEFIDNHAHDISAGGMFVKTQKAFLPGTLLKFEVRIAGDVAVISGVGRVAWKRDNEASTAEQPPGMGVKFIKLDEQSKVIIERLTSAKESAPAAPKPAPPAFPSITPEATEESDDDFSREETVVRQTRELLEQALQEAGGSLEELMNLPGIVASTSDPPMPLSSGRQRLDADSTPTIVREPSAEELAKLDEARKQSVIDFSVSEPLRGVLTPAPASVEESGPTAKKASDPPKPRTVSGTSERRSRPNLDAVAKPREPESKVPWFAIFVGIVVVGVIAIALRDRLFGSSQPPAAATSAATIPPPPSVLPKPASSPSTTTTPSIAPPASVGPSVSIAAPASASAPRTAASVPPNGARDAAAPPVADAPPPKPKKPVVVTPPPDISDNPY